MEKTLKHLSKIVVPEIGGSTGTVANLDLVNSMLGISPPSWTDSIPPASLPDSNEKRESGDSPPIEWFGDRLNDSQKDAIEFCLKSNQIACIHGPPGVSDCPDLNSWQTGKTHTLVELVFQLLSRPNGSTTPKILITTPSNLALDNILLRLYHLSLQPPYSTLLPPGSILRLGHPTRVHRELISQTLDYRASNGDEGELIRDVAGEIEGHLGDLAKKKGDKGAVKGKERGMKWGEVRELRKECVFRTRQCFFRVISWPADSHNAANTEYRFRQREAKVVKNVVSAARVVLATCHSAGSRQINNMTFDYCIIDEATQAVEAVCWVPILKSKKVILAGDPQQVCHLLFSLMC